MQIVPVKISQRVCTQAIVSYIGYHGYTGSSHNHTILGPQECHNCWLSVHGWSSLCAALPTLGEENEDDIETSMTKSNDDQCSQHSQSGREEQPDQRNQQEQLPDHPANLDSHVKSTVVVTTPKDQESQQLRSHQDSGLEVQTHWILLVITNNMITCYGTWCDCRTQVLLLLLFRVLQV